MSALPNTVSAYQALDSLEQGMRSLNYSADAIKAARSHVRQNGCLEGLVEIGFIGGEDEALLERIFADGFLAVPYDSPRWDDGIVWAAGPEFLTEV